MRMLELLPSDSCDSFKAFGWIHDAVDAAFAPCARYKIALLLQHTPGPALNTLVACERRAKRPSECAPSRRSLVTVVRALWQREYAARIGENVREERRGEPIGVLSAL